MSKNTKKSKKSVLVASMILAAMIVAGSSFAWFTSKDEVVNKLTAQSNYGVTIVEDFTPPSNWTPGYVVEKKVGVTNTGNIDAFVKMTLTNTLNLTTYGTSEEYNAGNTDKYVELSADKVNSLQAGGRIVYQKDTVVAEENRAVGTSYKPTDTGLYIFERSNDGTTATYEGYYYCKDAGAEHYYAIGTISGNTTDGFTAQLQTKKTETVTPAFAYDAANKVITATYGENKKAIKINIKLDETELTKWTENDETTPTFYYNNTLKAGTSTGKLITSVELDKSVENDAYISMDYNLKITADSAQVTDDDEKTTAVNAQNWVMAATATTDADGNITSVTWAEKTTP